MLTAAGQCKHDALAHRSPPATIPVSRPQGGKGRQGPTSWHVQFAVCNAQLFKDRRRTLRAVSTAFGLHGSCSIATAWSGLLQQALPATKLPIPASPLLLGPLVTQAMACATRHMHVHSNTSMCTQHSATAAGSCKRAAAHGAACTCHQRRSQGALLQQHRSTPPKHAPLPAATTGLQPHA